MQPLKEKQPDIDLKKLHEMFVAGVTFVKMGEEIGTSSQHCQHLISRERQKDPVSWPCRRPQTEKQLQRATKSFDKPPAPPILATRPPLKPNLGPMNTECITRQATPEERIKYGIKEVADEAKTNQSS